METANALWNRLGVMTSLTNKIPRGKLGRTAIMKLLYFLQTLRQVPLDYNFRLYTYGPFDSSVLEDLKYGVSIGGLKSELEVFSSGYGYNFSPGEALQEIEKKAKPFLKTHQADIKWVAEQFGNFSAAELELLSTIVFVHREFITSGEQTTFSDLTQRVHEIKPHFPNDVIEEKIRWLTEREIVSAG